MAGSDSRRSTSNSPGKMISEAEKASAQTGGSKGSLRLFQFFGTTVYVHWSWFLVAYFQIQDRAHEYTWFGWNVLEYVSTFLIVLLHEFGHVFACKSVGGVANKVVLWPLGGVALVSTPRRAGAAADRDDFDEVRRAAQRQLRSQIRDGERNRVVMISPGEPKEARTHT